VAPAAFCGSVLACASDLFDMVPDTAFRMFGMTREGFGRNNPGRFDRFVTGGTRLGTEFHDAWTGMRAEVKLHLEAAGVSDEAIRLKAMGLLARVARSAGLHDLKGAGTVYLHQKAQKQLTASRENARVRAFSRRVALLARDDPRHIAWKVADQYSSRFLQDAASSDDAVLSNAEWAEAVARYAGVASPACKPWVGMKLQVKGEPVLDPHGDVLFAATTCLNKGNARTMWHDGMQRALKRTCQVAGVRFEQGLVVPIAREAGMGDDAIRSLDREERAARSKAGGGKRLLPDISVEGNLGDVKTLNSLKWYTLRADGGFAGGKSPVDRRAADVNTKYLHKAHTADVKHNGQPSGQRGGPLETALRRRGHVEGYVFGSFGEVSACVDALARRCAQLIGRERAAAGVLRAPPDADPADYVLPEIRRDWGVQNVKRRAQTLLYVLAQTCPGSTSLSLFDRSQYVDDMMQRARLLTAVGRDRVPAFVARSVAGRADFVPPLPLTPALSPHAPAFVPAVTTDFPGDAPPAHSG